MSRSVGVAVIDWVRDCGVNVSSRTDSKAARRTKGPHIMAWKYRDRELSDSERYQRGALLSEAYLLHPMGSVVAINLKTAEYVVGAHAPEAMYTYQGKFPDADADMYLEAIQWPDTRPIMEDVRAATEWCRQWKARQTKRDDPT
jgi:hypothetical protein